ncbi:MAG: Xaa-Pro peptidase family protein [Agriterribacter sp.]
MLSRVEKLNTIADQKKIDAFLLTAAPSVKYFSGYFFYFEYGVSPFHFLPAALFVKPSYTSTIILADNELQQEQHLLPGITVSPYSSYVYETPTQPAQQFLQQLFAVLDKHNTAKARIGIEPAFFPVLLADALAHRYAGIEFVDVSAEIQQLRAIKDNDEIECIKKAAHLCDIGQATVLKNAEAGISELELFNIVCTAIESNAGERVPLMCDLGSGVRTAAGGGMPGNKIIESGDLVLSDFTVCLNGYWGDSCNTIAVGEPTAEQKKIFAQVKETLQMGIDAIYPGVKALEIDKLMRSYAGNFPHHGGHGVGIDYHEEPRIVPYNEMVLLPNMVIALEPAVYKNDFGIRLEHLVQVTENGCEIITRFQHQFY